MYLYILSVNNPQVLLYFFTAPFPPPSPSKLMLTNCRIISYPTTETPTYISAQKSHNVSSLKRKVLFEQKNVTL